MEQPLNVVSLFLLKSSQRLNKLYSVACGTKTRDTYQIALECRAYTSRCMVASGEGTATEQRCFEGVLNSPFI